MYLNVCTGQGVDSDIKWMDLQKGTDFQQDFDLANAFRAYNPKYNNYSFSSLEHTATTLLDVDSSAHGIVTNN